jgi:nucleoside-diphosphate-sugar epimerase
MRSTPSARAASGRSPKRWWTNASRWPDGRGDQDIKGEIMPAHHALVTGAFGVVGLNLVQELAERGDWALTAVGRRAAPPPVAGLRYVRADLADAQATLAGLSGLSDVTHLFFAAFQYKADRHEEVAANLAIFDNTLDALKAAGAPLQRVVIYQGSKAYGALLGNMRTPAKETDPRVPGPLFYYDQEDRSYARGAADGFATTVLRPDFVAGIGLGSYVNLVNTVAVYGAVCKALDMPMYFPGGPAAYDALMQHTDARLLARGAIWAALEPHRENIVYNITNGDLFRWSNVWPRIADYFGVPAGRPMHVDLKMFMADKRPLWAELKRRHGLVVDLDDLMDWNQAYILSAAQEIHSSTIRIRKAGFQDCLDSDDRLIELFDEMRARRYIP